MRKLRFLQVAALAWILTLISLALLANWLPLADPISINLQQARVPPSHAAWFGTDELGRDVLSRWIFASRPTLLVTFGASALQLALGILLGTIAGYKGGMADRAISTLIDFFWSVPFVVFVILVVSIIGVTVPIMILSIAAINWVTSARIIRAEIATLKQREFVRTARAFGASERSIAFQYILPNLRFVLLTLAAYGAVEVLTLETGLAFLGLSMPAPRPTWGGLLSEGASYFTSAWWLVAVSAGAITLTLASFQSLAQGFERTT